jgi:hypothetical protein
MGMTLDEIKEMDLEVGERIEITLQEKNSHSVYTWYEIGYFKRIVENDEFYLDGIEYSSCRGIPWHGCKINGRENKGCLIEHIQNIRKVA